MYEIFESLLQKYGVTTYQVAKATGISTASFTGWKQGKWNFKQDKLQKIADYFGVTVDYLMTGREDGEIKQPAPELELSNVYFSLAKEAEQNGIDPRDIKMAIEMLRKIREEEKKKRQKTQGGKELE